MEKQLRRLDPKNLSLKEQVAVAVLREIIEWGRDNPDLTTELDPVRQYEGYVNIFNKLAVRELKGRLSGDADEAIDQLNMPPERSAKLLELAGIGYPLSITELPPRYI